MQVRFSESFKVDDNFGNTVECSTVSVYIDCILEQNYEPLKSGIASLCGGMAKIITETKGAEI